MEKVQMPQALAQMMELRSRWKAENGLDDDPDLPEPGDLVVEKPGFNTHSSVEGDIIGMVWGYIDQENEIHAMCVAQWAHLYGGEPFWDIFVGYVLPTSGKFYTRPHTSAWLRKLTEEEMKGLD